MTEIITYIASAPEEYCLFCQRFTIQAKILRNGDQVGKNARDAANPRLKRVSLIQLAKSIESSHRHRLTVPALRGSSSNEAFRLVGLRTGHGVCRAGAHELINSQAPCLLSFVRGSGHRPSDQAKRPAVALLR